jgi:hypothetical protein
VPGDYVVRALRGVGGGVHGFEAVAAGGGDGNVVISSGNWAIVEATEMERPKPTPTRYASTPLTVGDRDVTNLSIGLMNGAPLGGTVEFVDRQDKPDPNEFRQIGIVIEALDGRTAGFDFEMTGRVDKDGKFETVGLPAGRYLVKVPRVPAGWTLESVQYAGRDVSDRPLDVGPSRISGLTIRLTNRPSTLAGSVRNTERGTGNPEPQAVVIAFPTDRTQWRDYGSTPRRLQMTGVSADGSYEIRGLPPGDYFVAAVRDDYVREWRAPAFLEVLAASASRVTIARGERASQALTVIALAGGGR